MNMPEWYRKEGEGVIGAAENTRPAYWWRVLVWLDQGLNVIFGPVLNLIFRIEAFGDEDETLSSVMGKFQHSCRLCRWMCRWLDKIDPGHCEESIERDEGVEHY